MSTKQSNPATDEVSLGARISEALDRSQSADPRVIAARVRTTLSVSEVESLVGEALVERIRIVIGHKRTLAAIPELCPPRPLEQPVQELERTGNGIIVWPEDDVLVEAIGDGTYGRAAEKLGVGQRTLRDYCRRRGIPDSEAHYQAESDGRFFKEMAAIVADHAAKVRAEGIKIGLEQAKADRVYVAGRWMFLVDCTPEHLRWLADDYTKRAASNAERGAYYLALAEQLEADGYADVRAMCEAGG